jgi:L-asparaginase
MKTIQVLFTGGTIGMRRDDRGVAVPGVTGAEIFAAIPDLAEICHVQAEDWASLPSCQMTPDRMWALYQRVQQAVADPAISGVVITHGTDTLEETAYFLDLLVDSPKPIVVTGAMRTQSELSWDGPANLAAALRVAASDQAAGYGTMVVVGETILAAAEATKTHTEDLGTFQSPNFGPLGIVDNGKVLFYRRPFMQQHIPAPRLEERVDLIKMVAGADDRFFRFSVDSGAKGIVLEALGRGNVPPAVVPGVAYAQDHGVPVVLVSRCLRGRVLNTYGYEGSGDQLRRLGVIFADHLVGQKARIKLMLALGYTQDYAQIKEIFEAGRY